MIEVLHTLVGHVTKPYRARNLLQKAGPKAIEPYEVSPTVSRDARKRVGRATCESRRWRNMYHSNKVHHIGWLAAFALLFSLIGAGSVGNATVPAMGAITMGAIAMAAGPGDLLFTASGDLAPGEVHQPGFPVFTARNVTLKLTVPAVVGDGAIALAFSDGTGTNTFNGTIRDGETLWATLTVKPGGGNNTFSLENVSGGGGPPLDYELWVYEIDNAPFQWGGTSQGAGTWRSHIRLNFPASGLYQFSFGVGAGGRYQFLVDGDYVQKTVESAGAVTYFVAGGVHDLFVEPDPAVVSTDWTLDISEAGASSDTLPYTKAGGSLGGPGNAFFEEWLPLNLAVAAPANFELALTGDSGHALDVHLYGPTGTTPVSSVTGIFGGETLWWTTDLPPGVSRIQIVADAANGPLAYDLTIHARPGVPASWTGTSLGAGNNAQARFEVGAAGLYDLVYDVTAGRYQFLVDSEPLIQKTVEAAGTVRYYLGAGTHELTVVQDTNEAATGWSLAITATGTSYDTLPYHKTGGNLGGTGNDFVQEWLPLNVEAGGPANFELTLNGDLADGLVASLYQGTTEVYSTPVVYGGETFWWTADLAAGLNQLELEAEGNVAPLAYDLTIHPIPSPPAAWSGVAKGSASNSMAVVNIATAGTYSVTLDTPTGFAQVLVDGAESARKLASRSPGQVTEFVVPLAAGNHSFEVVQSAAYPTTEWSVAVEAAAPGGAAGDAIAHLTGNLVAGEQVAPQIPLLGTQDKDVNLRLAVSGGGPLDLAITAGLATGRHGLTFAGTALDGEVVWGTTTLEPGQNTFTLLNSGAAPVAYDLTVYEIDQTPYDWAGASAAAGDWDSQVKLNFAADGLYEFDFGVLAGRYQFLVDGDYVQKTIEADGQVSYYVPAGDHLLAIRPDRSADASWLLDVSAPGAPADTLPYTKSGGKLWPTADQFDEEWLPLNLAAATPANFELTLTGAESDALDVATYVAVYAGMDATEFYSVTGVYGGETVWWTVDLPAGLNRVHLLADAGNGASLAYSLTVNAVPGSPAAWAGTSHGNGNNSLARFEVDTAGLYELSYGVASGRYQFLVDSEVLIQKTVETSGTVRYYLDAGMHDLTIDQDSLQGAAWSLGVATTGETYDTLPYHKTGGNLGGAGNDFAQEWLPLNVETGGPANFELSLDGDLADGLVASLYQGTTEVYSTPVVYGGETFWWTADLAAGVNHVKLVASDGNAGPLAYDLAVRPIPTVLYAAPHAWSGVSKGDGGHSAIDLQVPVSGTYHVAVNLPHGFAKVNIGELTRSTIQAPQQSHYEFDVPLDEGAYLFTVEQSSSYLTTTWGITVSMEEAAAPLIVSVDPASIVNDVAYAFTIAGANFQPGATVEIDSIALSPVTRLDSSTLSTTIPAGVPAGIYSVTVTNPDGKSDTLVDALTVVIPQYFVYLPLVARNGP
jgi:hypothetical protein